MADTPGPHLVWTTGDVFSRICADCAAFSIAEDIHDNRNFHHETMI